MPAINGRSDIVGAPIQLGDFLPERRYVDVNGQRYTAWVTTNRRYPRSIMARLDRAARVYNRVISPLLQPMAEGEEPDEARLRAAEEQPEAWQQYVTESVLLLVPTLLESEIELVPLDALENLLRELGYFPPLEDTQNGETQQEAETTSPPNSEDANVPLTGDTSQPGSPDSMEPALTTS